jgi:hypothetical protein
MHLFVHVQNIFYLWKWGQICIVYSLNYQYDASVQEVYAHCRHDSL